MRGLRILLRDAWGLAAPYFRSEEKAVAWALLLGAAALTLTLVGADVVLNYWNGAFYDALQSKDWRAFLDLLLLGRRSADGPFGVMPGFCLIAAPYILFAVHRTYLTQALEIRWRRWLTERFLGRWLEGHAHYRVGLRYGVDGDAATDNPDQRIAEDLRDFIGGGGNGGVLTLGLDLLSNIASLGAFLGILWRLSGPVTVLGVAIPGYMVWVALLYAAAGSWLTHLVGRRLAGLNFRQQRFEADFRFGLARVREHGEGIALLDGEAWERRALGDRFGHVVENWWAIMRRAKALNALTSGYSQLAVIFPILVAAPRYFAGKIPLGGLTRTASAFGQVQSAMSWLVTSYASLAAWRAVVARLASFERALAASPGPPPARRGARPALRDFTLRRPDGEALLERATVEFPETGLTRLRGRSGKGKSTMFRALAGIWPYGEGVVERPPGRSLFLPQKPYAPPGALRAALAYPEPAGSLADGAAREALRRVGLGSLEKLLEEEADWGKRLSGGEMQRLALARALLRRPGWLFLDEATAGLEPEAEAALLRALCEELPGTRIVFSTHRPPALPHADLDPWPASMPDFRPPSMPDSGPA